MKKSIQFPFHGGNEGNISCIYVNITCWKKKSIFFELEYWKYLHIRHNLDVMHIEENFYESIIGTLLNFLGKTNDGINV